MILPASYLNGFAPRDGQPLYPSLWTGCVGAWNPGLGPSGSTLRDNSGLGNHGTLTNGPTFAPSGGRYAMSFDGVDDYVNASGKTFIGEKTITAWIYSTGSVRCGIFGTRVGNNGCAFVLNSPSAGNLRYYHTTVGDSNCAAAVAVNIWTHVAVSYSAALIIFFKNGSQIATATSFATEITTTSKWIGAEDSTSVFAGQIDDVRIYNRALSPDEIRLLATRPSIAYEMAPRRRSSVQVTVAPLRYNLFSGSIGNTDVIGAS